jgi:hypothetical protein
MALKSVFTTNFLHRVLSNIASSVDPTPVVHVGAVDSWPTQSVLGRSAVMIFNTDYANEVGQHWVAVFLNKNNQKAYIFDSLPDRPFPGNVLRKIDQVCDYVADVNAQRFQLQHRNFPLCGLYCLAFLDHYLKDKPFHLCYDNPLLNDVRVVEMVLPYIVNTFDI